MLRNYCAKCKKKIRFDVLKQNVRKVIRTCPNIDFPRDHMHGVNISNHTWGQALRNEARLTENIALYYHVFVLLTALNNNDVQSPSTLTAAQNSPSNSLQITIPTFGWCVRKIAR